MSIIGSIDLKTNGYSKSIVELLGIFHQHGWQLHDEGIANYLPLGDELFDWAYIPKSEIEVLYNILLKKQKKQEIIGICLVLDNSSIGASFLFYPNLNDISIILDINRNVIKNLYITDFTWYLERLIPMFYDAGFLIEVIECIDG